MDDLTLALLIEICTYITMIAVLAYVGKKREYKTLFLFVYGFIFAFFIEVIAMVSSGDYSYNPAFLINLGSVPNQVPLWVAVGWGLLITGGYKVAVRFELNRLATSLITYWFVIAWDFAFDVYAIRILGGFWTWSVPVNFDITLLSFYGVFWGNYIAYAFVIIPLTYFISRSNEKIDDNDIKKQLMYLPANLLCSIAIFTPLLIGVRIIDETIINGFSFASFAVLFTLALVLILKSMFSRGVTFSGVFENIEFLVIYVVFHMYSIIAGIHLNIHRDALGLFILEIILFGFTLIAGMISLKEASPSIKPESLTEE